MTPNTALVGFVFAYWCIAFSLLLLLRTAKTQPVKDYDGVAIAGFPIFLVIIVGLGIAWNAMLPAMGTYLVVGLHLLFSAVSAVSLATRFLPDTEND